MRVAFASMAWNTGSSSPGELLMTLEHLRRRRLLLQRLAQFPRALLLGVEQPHVLDGDHRLVGKRFSQLDLLVGERLHDAALSEAELRSGVPSRSNGTPSIVRTFPDRDLLRHLGSPDRLARR